MAVGLLGAQFRGPCVVVSDAKDGPRRSAGGVCALLHIQFLLVLLGGRAWAAPETLVLLGGSLGSVGACCGPAVQRSWVAGLVPSPSSVVILL